MKKSFLLLGAALLTLAACQREELPQLPQSPAPISLKVDALANDPDADDPATKTYIDENRLIRWSSGEYMKLMVKPQDTSAYFFDSQSTSADWDGQTRATFDFSISIPYPASSYTFAGFYPLSAVVSSNNTDPTSYKVSLPSVQLASQDSYDPAAYLLLAGAEEVTALGDETWQARFQPVTALNKLTLTNLPEGIHTVTITASGKKLAGRRTYNLLTGEAAGSVYEDSDHITVRLDEAQSSTATIWFTSWNTEIAEGETLTVAATGNTHTYTRTITARAGGISFLEGKLNLLQINMDAATPSEVPSYEGYYLIAGLAGGNWQLMNEANEYSYITAINSSVSGSSYPNPEYANFSGVANRSHYIWQVAADGLGYTLRNTYTGKYLALTANENSAREQDQPDDNSLFYLSGNLDNISIYSAVYPDRKLQYNSQNPRFAFYTTAQTAIRLIPAEFVFLSAVTTGSASGISEAGATLWASYSDIELTSAPTNVKIVWGTAADNLTQTAAYAGSISSASGSYSVHIGPLSQTTYYYKAEMTVYNRQSGKMETIQGAVRSFTVGAAAASGGWLELPAIPNSWSALTDYYGHLYGSGEETGTNRNYSYWYNYATYASLWVAYPLCSNHFNVDRTRKDKWAFNPQVNQDYQVTVTGSSYSSMYGNSNYARGHQIPNADRKRDDQMNLQTFYVTNQTPQWQNGFNSGIWSSLEEAARTLAGNTDTLYVATGPIYQRIGYEAQDAITYLTGAAGKNASPASLPIPNYFWKAFLKVERNGSGEVTGASTIAFLFENRNYAGSNYDNANYIRSVNQIESLTGLNLFANLPDGIEETAEANTNWTSFQNYATQ